MRKYFYKGESLSILFQTPVPETGERVKITDFQVGATIQGITPSIDVLSDYEMQLFLSSVQTKQMTEGRADIVITLTQGETVVIGKNIALFVSDPLTARPIDGMSDTEDMQLAINTGDVVFDIEFKDLGWSAYQYYRAHTTDNPPLEEEEYEQLQASFAQQEILRIANEDERILAEQNRQQTISLLITSINTALEDSATATESALSAASYATEQGDYAKEQGDYVKNEIAASVGNKVDKTIEVTAGNGLTGGGALSENRTLNVVSANDAIAVNSDSIELITIDNLTSESVTKPLSAKQGKALQDSKVPNSLVGAASGLAQLDATGKHKIEQYQDIILGQLKYGGAFDNDGLITSDYSTLNGQDIDLLLATDWKGFFFIFSGTTSTHHSIEFEAGDWLISNGSAGWAKIDNTDAVTLVNGQKGNVTLNTDHIAEGATPTNKWFTEARVRASLLTGLSATNSAIAATDTVLQGFNKSQGQITDIVTKINASALTANTIQKWDGAKSVNSAIREVGGKVAVGNDTPLANIDWVGSSLSRGDVYTYRDVVSKYLGGGTSIGAVVITVPIQLNPMLVITIKGYDFSSNSQWEVVVGGHYSNSWYESKTEIRGANPFGNQVRLGKHENYAVIVLGGIDSDFSYAAISVCEVRASFSDVIPYGTGWTITQVTDLTDYTLVTPTTHVYYHSGNLTPNLTPDYLPRWDGTKLVNSGIIESGGNVLLGYTSNPASYKFAVNGSGYFNGALTIDGGLITFGANDSAGAGYRILRVPNI